ncbi:MAG: NAD-binding protein [Coriobacteriia bacterium]|nr:NAD-binding protein [Coriobacteriia bacterium]
MADPSRRRRTRLAEWWGEVHWYALAGLAAVAFVLGVIGFQQWYAVHGITDATLADAVYRSLQLFTLESGSAETPVPIALNVARFLAIIAALYGATAAVLAVFGEHLSRLRIRRAKGHTVVCGLGDRGLHITEHLRQEGRRVVVVERAEDAPLLDRVRAAGAVPVIGDATDPAVLRTVRADRAKYVIAVCPEDGDNAEIAVRVRELASGTPAGPPVTVIAHIYDTELCTLLRDRTPDGQTGRVRLRFFNVPESGARAMLDAVPPVARAADHALHIVVVGMGKLGRSLVTMAAAQWLADRQPDGPRPRVTLIDQGAAAKADLLRVRLPRIDEACELVPLTMPKNAPEFERGAFLYTAAGALDVDAVYVCPDDDVHSLAAALTIQRHTHDAGVPIAVRMTREGGLATLLADEHADAFTDLKAVGVLDRACDPDTLLGQA